MRVTIGVVVFVGLAAGYWLMGSVSRPASPAALPAGLAMDPVAVAEMVAKRLPTPENYLQLSLTYDRAGRHRDTIIAAREALKLRPGYADAWNNIAAAYQEMGQWDEAIAAASQALRLRPDFQLAKNNLAWARSQKNKSK